MPTLNRAELRRVYGLPTWQPTDCPNFLTYSDQAEYRKYAIGILPFMLLGRARVRWLGERVTTLAGESPGETLMIVRYRSHRAMLRMIVNPLYLMLNRYRLRGTERLELAYTETAWHPETLGSEPQALGVHARLSDPRAFFAALHAVAEPLGERVAYASVERVSFSFLERPRRNDPNPLTYPHTALVEAPTEGALLTLASSAELERLLAPAERSCLQLYCKSSARKFLRPLRRAR